MCMSKLVYLAGPIDGLNYSKSTEWRNYAIEELAKNGIVGISPMRAKEFLKDYPKLTDEISDHVLASDSGVTTRDIWDVRRSDAILFNLLEAEKVSIGTMIEYGWASALNKPIITIIEDAKGKKRNVHEHLMIRSLSGFRVQTLEEGLAVIKALFAY